MQQVRDKQPTSIYLSVSLVNEVREIIACTPLSLSAAVGVAIQEWIDKQKQRKAVSQ